MIHKEQLIKQVKKILQFENNLTKVVEVYSFEHTTPETLTFSFQNITEMNKELFMRLLYTRDNALKEAYLALKNNNISKSDDFLFEVNYIKTIMTALQKKPIWHHIEIKR